MSSGWCLRPSVHTQCFSVLKMLLLLSLFHIIIILADFGVGIDINWCISGCLKRFAGSWFCLPLWVTLLTCFSVLTPQLSEIWAAVLRNLVLVSAPNADAPGLLSSKKTNYGNSPKRLHICLNLLAMLELPLRVCTRLTVVGCMFWRFARWQCFVWSLWVSVHGLQ